MNSMCLISINIFLLNDNVHHLKRSIISQNLLLLYYSKWNIHYILILNPFLYFSVYIKHALKITFIISEDVSNLKLTIIQLERKCVYVWTNNWKKNVNKCLYKSTHKTIKLLAFGDKLLLFTTITVCTKGHKREC